MSGCWLLAPCGTGLNCEVGYTRLGPWEMGSSARCLNPMTRVGTSFDGEDDSLRSTLMSSAARGLPWGRQQRVTWLFFPSPRRDITEAGQ
ncbi:hypothetical protein ASPVEDRAFT_36528 [Aspergillus versicolor CBS 583.65]|uniref:Uncharacterized protein n=1 Tax=Aspergillus versicolor CBS 583.65 TaxID=1036611 RepID=A0A1L9P6I5_ASPVE|nr:uncharacterized protein ASPVEDRAFT_36528 [Aspergillus versicolor CBS 583.65]OJI97137.1 hypothetical protein ASPVEDRAFT_36528 [Aspergillus versicolor CBS 583.65]